MGGLSVTSGTPSEDSSGKLRAPGLWVKTSSGWYPSSATPKSSERLLGITSVQIFDANNDAHGVPIAEIAGAQFIELWCDYYGLRWKIMAIYDDDGTLRAVEDPPDLPFDARRNADYERRHRRRFPIDLSDATMHVLIGHDDPEPQPFAHYQEVAAAIPNGKAFHPLEYNGLRVQALVPVTGITNIQKNVNWTYGDQS